jgi:sphingomyelin phosphodiesterase acid-like 3
MKNTKSHYWALTVIILNLFFSAASYAQTAKEKCFIVSDIHFDPMYNVHSDSTLKRKLLNTPAEQWAKLFEGSDMAMTMDAGLINKDANFGVLKSALDNMQQKLPHPAFIIIAGDFIWHGATPADSVLKRKTIRFIAHQFKLRFPNTIIIPAMGNNDTYGQDYALQDSRFLNDFADAWSPNLPKAAADELKKQGYYTCTAGNLKVMVYNSAVLNAGTNYPGAGPMLNWLQSNLASATTKNAWLLTHIPPGVNPLNNANFWNAASNQTFINTVVQYSSKVRLCIASHTHLNDFRVFYNTTGQPVAYLRIVPSICSNHGNNPSFDMATLDSNTGAVTAETNYYLNVAAIPKGRGVKQAVWTDAMSQPQMFQMNEVNADSFSKFMDKAQANPKKLIGDYIKFYTVGTPIDSAYRVNRHNYLRYFKADSLKAQ